MNEESDRHIGQTILIFILGLVVLFVVIGFGVFFSAVRDGTINFSLSAQLPPDYNAPYSFGEALEIAQELNTEESEVESIELLEMEGLPVYVVVFVDGSQIIVEADSGDVQSFIDAESNDALADRSDPEQLASTESAISALIDIAPSPDNQRPCDNVNSNNVINGSSQNDVFDCSNVRADIEFNGFAGDDEIFIRSGMSGALRGDVGTNVGGDDKIVLYPDASAEIIIGDNLPATATKFGNDDLIIQGFVANGVFGDSGKSEAIGGDDRIIISGEVVGLAEDNAGGNAVVGDGNWGLGGKDRIILEEGSKVTGDVKGDGSGGEGDGNADYLRVAGEVNGVIGGDVVFGNGGEDVVEIAETAVVGFVKGDAADKNGANDILRIHGRTTLVQGDDTFIDGADDRIFIAKTGLIERRDPGNTLQGSLAGDAAYRDGGDDLINIHGTIEQSVAGDGVNRHGGNDSITIYDGSRIGGALVGDGSFPGQDYSGGRGGEDKIRVLPGSILASNVSGDSAETAGADDTIFIGGEVKGHVNGDVVRRGNGGNDSIHVGAKGLIHKDIRGDSADRSGGVDSITIWGEVRGGVYGDYVTNGSGKADFIQIGSTSTVKQVYGDYALKASGADDVIIIQGTVLGNVMGDYVGKAAGADRITISGTVKGAVYPDGTASSSGADGDFIEVLPNGRVGGNISLKDGGVDELVVWGVVEGNVFCDKGDTLTFKEGGRVLGEIGANCQ